MKILIALTYYQPHISGLTIYVQRLARALAERGHQVTVLTAHFRRDLPYEETVDGVHIIRSPVAFKLSKGVIQPGITLRYLALAREHDVVSVHLPQAEAGAMSFIGRVLANRPVILTYHCDLQLPPGLVNRVIDRMTYATNWVGGVFADRIVAYTQDYAMHSPLLSQFKNKIFVVYPPVEMPPPQPEAVQQLRAKYQVDGCPVVGFAARFAEEKGVDYLIHSLPYVREKFPRVKYLFAGPYQDVIGENVWERLQPLIQKYRDHLEFLGLVPNREMGNFFNACDVLTVPSINSTESFGLVQIEAMLSGTPVVASNLPGVREPVRVTGMGEIAPIKDARGLAEGIIRVLENRPRYVRPRSEIEEMFALDVTVKKYIGLFEELIEKKNASSR
ncbi:MAG: glycosyltransferase family 4 protein [Anaerolineae bacterium]